MLRMTKHHGLGNDFLVALAQDNPGLTPDPSVARALCDRRRGVGADGLILGLEPSEADDDACMVLLNADGSEAEISGNGIRCLAQALLRAEGRIEGSLRIETAGGVRALRTVRGEADGEVWIQVDMGQVRPGPAIAAASAAYPALHRATLDIGNPHLVLHVEDPAAVDLAHDGARLESEYPQGMNVHFIQIPASDTMILRVWERGAGVTEACGSGATAAVAAAHGWGLVADHVEVHMPGGTAVVDVAEDTLLLTGPSVFVAEVHAP